MGEDKKQGAPEAPARDREAMSEAEIDRNLMGTFPASDPPSWTLGTDHHRESPSPAAEPPAQDESK